MKKVIQLLIIFLSVTCQGQNLTNEPFQNEVDLFIEDVMDSQGIPGIALAIVKNNKVIHQRNYGYANLEHQVPISDQSIFRVYSLTKPIVAVGIFQLVEQGKLDLEDQVGQYVLDLPEEWKSIKIKHLLSHSSGLPDMSPIPDFKELSEKEATKKVFSQKVNSNPGDQYDYNQTGFWLLQKVIEKIEGTSLSKWICNNQFTSPCDTAFFSSDSRDIVMNRVTPYFPFTKSSLTIDHSYLQGTYAHSSNGLNISLEEFIKWDNRLNNNKLIRENSKFLMWESFPYSHSDKIFTYGWDQRIVNDHVSFD